MAGSDGRYRDDKKWCLRHILLSQTVAASTDAIGFEVVKMVTKSVLLEYKQIVKIVALNQVERICGGDGTSSCRRGSVDANAAPRVRHRERSPSVMQANREGPPPWCPHRAWPPDNREHSTTLLLKGQEQLLAGPGDAGHRTCGDATVRSDGWRPRTLQSTCSWYYAPA